jgi:hypothetical protein
MKRSRALGRGSFFVSKNRPRMLFRISKNPRLLGPSAVVLLE